MKSIDRGKLAFMLSLCMASFAVGIATMSFKTFPYSLLRDAKASASALWRSSFSDSPWDEAVDSREICTQPAVRRHAGTAGTELILVSGGKNYMTTHSPDYGALAWIMDREGTVQHVWHMDHDLWSDLRKAVQLPGRGVLPSGLHLYPNGDLLVSFQGIDSWPYGIGIARVDKDSKLIWKKELQTHHWFSVGDNGRIYSPAHRAVASPYALGSKGEKLPGGSGRLLADVILVIDPDDGSVLDEIPMIDAIVEADRIGLFSFIETWDPMHLNDVRVVTKDLEKHHPLLKVGDLLVSFRELNAVGVLDGGTKRFKWLSSGVTVEQHSPRFFEGGVLAFDNRGGDKATGGSRLAWVDLGSDQSKTVFPRPGVPIPSPFFSSKTGRIDIHPDQRRALVAIGYSGAVWEIDLSTGETLWEYVYAHPKAPGKRRIVFTADYVHDVKFPMNRETEHPNSSVPSDSSDAGR